MPDISPHRFRRILVSAIALPTVLVSVVTTVLAFQVEQLLQMLQSVSHSNEVLAAAFEAEKLLIDTQSGIRGYLITKELRYLSPYQKGMGKINDRLSDLQSLVQDNKSQSLAAQKILLSSVKWQEHSRVMLDNANYPLNSQKTKQLNDQGKVIVDEIRLLFEEFVQEEVRLRNYRVRLANNQAKAVLIITVISAGMATFLLAISFNWLLRKLAKNYQELLKDRDAQAETLEQRVKERTESLAKSNHDLEMFAYTLSHDIRSPISAISLFAQVLQDHSVSELHYEWATKIVTLSSWMDDLTSDLLKYFTINKESPKIQPVNLQDLVENEVLARLAALIESRKPVFKISIFPLVLGDRSFISQIFLNLIGNAIKFVPSDRQPHIKIWTEYLDNQYVKIFIQDNGIGIDRRSYERIFQVFERLDMNYEGTGIGLAIAKKAAEQNGGTIGVFSEEGVGSTFWVTLRQA